MKNVINIVLAGNPNCGKTSIFNGLTGDTQKVGNWPGVTVEKKEGEFSFDGFRVNVIDLPGIYSLNAFSIDEKISRDVILEGGYDILVNIVDASNLNRNLYLTLQLLELNLPVILVLNMMDLVESQGIKIDTKLLEKLLNIPVVETIGNKSVGIEELKKRIVEFYKSPKGRKPILYSSTLEDEINKLFDLIDDSLLEKIGFKTLNKRWLILRIFENDEFLVNKLINDENGKKVLYKKDEIERDFIDKHGITLEDLVIENRYGYIKGLLNEVITKKVDIEEKLSLTNKIDNILTNKYLGFPILILILYIIFQIVFTLSEPLSGIIDSFFGILSNIVTKVGENHHFPDWLISLLVDGIIGGVGSILVFFPSIFILYFLMGILEDSGYMARAAFLMDKIMHKMGLHGKSFIPFILGFGCNVPAITATRTLSNPKDRILTIITIPLMSCSARLPIYLLFINALFKKNKSLILLSLYLIGIILAFVVARIFKNIFFKKEYSPLIMEMPPYHMPQFKGLIFYSWLKTKLFIKKAGTIILFASILIWALASLPWGVEYLSKDSILGKIGQFIAPVLVPSGFASWQNAVALLFGTMAKELVVGTLGILYNAGEDSLVNIISNNFNPLSGYAFMLMSLLYIPCVATIAAIKNEIGWKWAIFTTVYTILLGWTVATLFYQIGIFIVNIM